jgi:hypothetical protein
MKRIDRDYDRLPSWIRCSRALVPDFIIIDPKSAPVWEIAGTVIDNIYIIIFRCRIFKV